MDELLKENPFLALYEEDEGEKELEEEVKNPEETGADENEFYSSKDDDEGRETSSSEEEF